MSKKEMYYQVFAELSNTHKHLVFKFQILYHKFQINITFNNWWNKNTSLDVSNTLIFFFLIIIVEKHILRINFAKKKIIKQSDVVQDLWNVWMITQLFVSLTWTNDNHWATDSWLETGTYRIWRITMLMMEIENVYKRQQLDQSLRVDQYIACMVFWIICV